jgi:hypothetical protein
MRQLIQQAIAWTLIISFGLAPALPALAQGGATAPKAKKPASQQPTFQGHPITDLKVDISQIMDPVTHEKGDLVKFWEKNCFGDKTDAEGNPVLIDGKAVRVVLEHQVVTVDWIKGDDSQGVDCGALTEVIAHIGEQVEKIAHLPPNELKAIESYLPCDHCPDGMEPARTGGNGDLADVAAQAQATLAGGDQPAEASCKKVEPESCGGAFTDCIKAAILGLEKNLKGQLPGIIAGAKGVWNYGKSILNGTKTLEDVTSDLAHVAQAITHLPETIAKMKDAVNLLIKENFACQKWEGERFKSKCVEPLASWDCAACNEKKTAVCGVVGYLSGEALSQFVMGLGVGLAVKGVKEAGSLGKIAAQIASKSAGKLDALFAAKSARYAKATAAVAHNATEAVEGVVKLKNGSLLLGKGAIQLGKIPVRIVLAPVRWGVGKLGKYASALANSRYMLVARDWLKVKGGITAAAKGGALKAAWAGGKMAKTKVVVQVASQVTRNAVAFFPVVISKAFPVGMEAGLAPKAALLGAAEAVGRAGETYSQGKNFVQDYVRAKPDAVKDTLLVATADELGVKAGTSEAEVAQALRERQARTFPDFYGSKARARARARAARSAQGSVAAEAEDTARAAEPVSPIGKTADEKPVFDVEGQNGCAPTRYIVNQFEKY